MVSTSNYELSSETGPAFPILWSADLVSWNLVRYNLGTIYENRVKNDTIFKKCDIFIVCLITERLCFFTK